MTNSESSELLTFKDLDLSLQTKKALEKAGYTEMTDIQKAALPLALQGKDILGAAKTGSGKTLAFLIPILELLNKENWSNLDGLGALVITPTRELALQIFEVLKNIGHRHSFSAGLVIGGKKLSEEQACIGRMNILICTPGRLLQHMDQTVHFDTSHLKVLVLDEADRILDMGFYRTVQAILENLPLKRQTLLFSATQTTSIQDLARVALNEPSFVQVHEMTCIPSQLQQFYMICPMNQKYDWLYSFIRTHLQSKMIVFVSSCKQVRFLFEAFCKLQPGIPLTCLFGKQHQLKRIATFKDFCRKSASVLFATDIAARGLDFPSVDWVIQFDCPDSLSTYIHRVGRTARYNSDGNALLFLTPQEEHGMLKHLQPLDSLIKMDPNPSKLVSIQSNLVSICSEYPSIKYLAQRAIVSYIRSIHLQPDKTIFQLPSNEEIHKFSASMGLASTPMIFFGARSGSKNTNYAVQALEEPVNNVPDGYSSDENIITKKPIGAHIELHDANVISHKPKKKQSVAKRQKISLDRVSGKKIIYDDDGNAIPIYENANNASAPFDSLKEQANTFYSVSRDQLSSVDAQDKQIEREKKREKRKEMKNTNDLERKASSLLMK